MPLLVKSNHNLTRQQLYAISEMVHNSGLENIAGLFAYKPKYVTGKFTTMETNRHAAMELPGQYQITYGHVSVRLTLSEFNEICCENMMKLKGGIVDSFPKNRHKSLLNLAGLPFHEKAKNQNWLSTIAMNELMIDFVADSELLDPMTSSLNIKDTLPAKISTDSVNFADEHSLFNTAKQTGVATTAKITADNLCNDNLTEVCADAQLAFIGFPEIQKLFVVTTLKDIIAPPGSASFKLTAEMVFTFLKKEGLLVTIQEEGQPAMELTTDINGEVFFENINPAKYKVKVEGTGIISQTFEKDVDTGTHSHSEVFMGLIPPPPPPPPVEPVV